ncbi:hypothetical protein G6O69_15795 [Pseudenhygromyxa sp. WMMC2535]|uniref:hypothetical protein n=1 Tax=Pseudenhygromyxa sp. WMMC2535 TaxID=2712867 RepID=UPI00155616D8|nr:hypothetical protein [Pseudenhygromyxa sp. WMMC2535]NVB39306.1 hypothetical protein [Pseudenhygromyxa sp. WMMC2535]
MLGAAHPRDGDADTGVVEAKPAQASEPTELPDVSDGVSAPKLEQYDKQLEKDPEWDKLSEADKRLLIEWLEANPGEEPGDVDFTAVTTGMKLRMALKLSWRYWPEELQEAAYVAFTDGMFLAQLAALTTFHVYLWVAPDPSGVTKGIAAVLTAYLLTMFAWHDIVGFAQAFLSKAKQQLARAEMIADGYAVDPDVQAGIRFKSAYYRLKPILDRVAKHSTRLRRLIDWANDKGKPQLPGEIAEMIAREQLRADLGPDQSVTESATLVVKEVPGYTNIDQFIADEVAAGQPEPDRFTMREGDGKVWRVIAEIDNLPYDAGTLRAVVMEFWDNLPPDVQKQMMPPLTTNEPKEDEP